MLTTVELEVSYHFAKLYTREAELKHQHSMLKYARVPLANVYLLLTPWHIQDTPLLLGSVYKTRSSSSWQEINFLSANEYMLSSKENKK